MAGPSRKEPVAPDVRHPENPRANHPAPPHSGPPSEPEQQVMEMLAGFEERLAELRRLWEEHRTAEARLMERETAFARREMEHTSQEEGLAAKLQAAEQQRAELEARANELREVQEQARQYAEQTEARQRELAEVDAKLRGRDEQLTDQQRSIEERENQLRATAERIAQVEREAAEAKAAAEQAVASARGELKGAISDRDVLSKELEKREALTSGLQVQIETHRAELEAIKARLAESNNARGTADQQTQAARQEADTLVARLKEQITAQEARAADLTGQLEKAEAELRHAREHPPAPRATKTSAELAEARKHIAELEARLQVVKSQAESHGARVVELERQAIENENAPRGKGTLESEEITALRSELERTRTELSLAVQSCDQTHAELKQAHADLKKSQARASRQTAGGVAIPAYAKDAPTFELRRARLARAKRLQREQSNKIRAVNDALRKRMEQCEQVLGLRAELSQARQALDQAHRRVQKQRGVGRVVTALMSTTVIVAMLGALSWVIAGEIWPGDFVATAKIQALARGRELLPEEREEWQKYHEDLIGDPRLVEKAAENLAKRGITSLGEPGALGQYLRANLVHQSPGAGKLTIELRGDGAERTTRILDTVVTTLASEANAARSKRIDGGTTDIEEAATPGMTSVDETRLNHAGMVWGGSTAVFCVLGLLIWTRLAAAKLKYDGQMHVEHVLEPDRWPTIPGLGPRPSGSPVPSTPGRS